MANWYGVTRTNYFHVKDEQRYKELFQGLDCEDTIEDFTDERGHGFGGYGDIAWYPPVDDNGNLIGSDEYENDGDWWNFLCELSDILADGSPFVSITVGHEKLRYLTGIMYIVFPGEEPKSMSLDGIARDMCREKLGDDFVLECTY